jgi:hypothetical protein
LALGLFFQIVVTIQPERIVKEDGEVRIVEAWHFVRGRPRRVAGYYVQGGRGDSSVLYPTLEDAEIEFLRRTWGT